MSSPPSTASAPASCAGCSRAARPGASGRASIPTRSATSEAASWRRSATSSSGGLVELKAADVRQRYTLRARPESIDGLRETLAVRFDRREHAETERLQRVLSLVTHEGCQVNSLVGYFGEEREEPCGHCTFCLSGRAQRLPAVSPLPPVVDERALGELRAAHPEALASPRQCARFLCGLTSPATTRAKLTRHPLFGALADRRFLDVLRVLG
jgi:ATP-dependent DNA helicase RecQ